MSIGRFIGRQMRKVYDVLAEKEKPKTIQQIEKERKEAIKNWMDRGETRGTAELLADVLRKK